MRAELSRLLCRILGHDWVDASPNHQVCVRRACRGTHHGMRRTP